MFDVIVVGARVSGASTALLFARHGLRVLLIDRARFPSETMSTLYIHQPGVARLGRWGLLERLAATGCPRLDRVSYSVADVRIHATAPSIGEVDCAYAPRRAVLDLLLIEAAVAAGAEFRAQCRAVGLVEREGRVAGVKVLNSSGRPVELRARLVVGADGMRSSVARLAGARITAQDPLLSCVYYSMWHNVPAHYCFFEEPGSWVAVIPTHDETTVVATYLPQHRFDQIRRGALGGHLATIKATAPDLYERLQTGERVGRLYGTGDQQNFFREPAGPGWALVGDAGHHKDSITARGITDALLHAELLTEALAGDLADHEFVQSGLKRYWTRRDETFAEPYQNAISLAQLQITPGRLDLMRAVAASPDLTRRFFSAVAGITGIDELFTPELLESLA